MKTRPVDVYDPTGQRVFTGSIVGDAWQAAKGSFVYRLEWDADTGEQSVARYELRKQF